MDYPLGGRKDVVMGNSGNVLIPILMDYPLGEKTFILLTLVAPARLNPYSNGLPSRGHFSNGDWYCLHGLNPYSNGLPSRGCPLKMSGSLQPKVLIPILMDYPLGGF